MTDQMYTGSSASTEAPMTPDKIDDLIAQAKSLKELGDNLLAATEALKETPPDVAEDKFTQEELNTVLQRIDDLKASLSELVV